MAGRWIIPICFDALLVLVALTAWWRGGRTERQGATIIVLGTVVTLLVARFGQHRSADFQPMLFTVDLVVLLAFTRLMIVTDRFWPIWATAFQLLSTASGLGPMARDGQGGFALGFAFDEQVWSWLILLQVGVVSASHRRPLRPLGQDESEVGS